MAEERVSDRHEGDLGGKLAPFDSRRRLSVRIVIEPELAAFPAIQHTAWMSVNLLARLDGIVTQVRVSCPPVPVHERTVPFGSSALLDQRLVEAANAIDQARFSVDDGSAVDRVIYIGATHANDGELVAFGYGWWGGVSRANGIVAESVRFESSAPFGPYLAAAFAVGELYLEARGVLHNRRVDDVYGWDCWAQRATLHPPQAKVDSVDLSGVALAGVGAVGVAWMHSMWAYDGVSGKVPIVDADVEGVSETNLNRGVLFARSDIGRTKSSVASDAACGGPVTWQPHDGRYQDQNLETRLLVSAVDTNRSREALQNTYPPRIIGGSTRDLRAEVLVVGRPGVGACLRCFNEPEPLLTDDELHNRARHRLDLSQRAAADSEVDDLTLKEWIEKPECGQISARFLDRLRTELTDPDVSQFSVGFVSLSAGVLLAVETIRALSPSRRSVEHSTAVRLQFFRPSESAGERSELRQEACPKCLPNNVATPIWRAWYDAELVET